MSEDFLKQTAKDYDLPLEIVKGIAEKFNSEEFYSILEDEIKVNENTKKRIQRA